MTTFEILLLLLGLCVVLAAMAQRLQLPVAVPMMLGGMGLAMIPGLPPVKLDAELALALFLPPLLQISAYRTDWSAFHSNLRPILLLAVGGVLFTAVAVAVVAYLTVPGLSWWAAVALGAIVAPPDAVAASSVLKRFKLPKRLIVILEGESLINDATSLVLYRFAVSAVTLGAVSYWQGAWQFVAMALGGALIGALVGYVAIKVLGVLSDTALEISLSILAGFAAYFAAEAVHASGVLGTVMCGLVLGRKQHLQFTAQTRLELKAVWNFTEFVLSSFVFMLIGLQLRGIVQRLGNDDLSALTYQGVAVAAGVIVSRFVWVFGCAAMSRWRSAPRRDDAPTPPWTHSFIVSWAGMRGVVSLAAALALPDGFPARDLIIFLAFCSILATLVLQGTTLGWWVRRLALVEPAPAGLSPEESRARAEIADAALDAVKSHVSQTGRPEHSDAAQEIIDEYAVRAGRANDEGGDREQTSHALDAQDRLRLVAIAAAREKLLTHADAVELESHRAIVRELDLEEQKVRGSTDPDGR